MTCSCKLHLLVVIRALLWLCAYNIELKVVLAYGCTYVLLVLHDHLLTLSLVKCAEVSARKFTSKDYSLISNSERLL